MNLRIFVLGVLLVFGQAYGMTVELTQPQIVPIQPQPQNSPSADTNKPEQKANGANNGTIVSEDGGTQKPEDYPNNQKNESRQDIEIRLSRYMVYITVGLFVVGACQVWVTRRYLQRQLRAYVFTGAINPVVYKDDSDNWRFRFSCMIKNTGQTPAHFVSVTSKAIVFRQPLDPKKAFPDVEMTLASVMALGAGQEFPNEGAIRRVFTQNEMDIIKAGKEGRLYIYGRIEYRDIFLWWWQKNRHTSFRLVVVFNGDEPPKCGVMGDGNNAN